MIDYDPACEHTHHRHYPRPEAIKSFFQVRFPSLQHIPKLECTYLKDSILSSPTFRLSKIGSLSAVLKSPVRKTSLRRGANYLSVSVIVAAICLTPS